MKRIHALWPTGLVIFSLLLALIGERVFAGAGSTRFVFAGLAAAGLVAAVLQRVRELGAASAHNKPVAKILLLATFGALFAMGLYALIEGVFHGDSEASVRIRAVLWVSWPIDLAMSLFTIVAIEFSTAPAAFIDRYEVTRVKQSATRGLSLALLFSTLFFINLLATRHNEKWDFSAGTKAVASDATQRVVRDLTKEVKIVLFFPRNNDVAEAADRYFAPLAKLNSKVTVERVDHALSGELARSSKVTENGYIAIMHGKGSEKVRLGTKIKSARSNLRRLDQNFVKGLIKVTTEQKTAYFVSGHDERPTGTREKEDKRPAIKTLKRHLESWKFTIKDLSLANGLAEKLPDDASIIFIIGPEKPFLPAEIATLEKGLRNGARLMIALEAERDGSQLDPLLSSLGLTFDRTLLANTRTNAPVTRTKIDAYHVWSNKYSSHESVTTMTRNNKIPTVLFKAGSLDKMKDGPKDAKAQIVLRGVTDTFGDANLNVSFESETEKKKPYGLAAAITVTSTSGKKDNEGRAFVVSDADVFADSLTGIIKGNSLLFADAVYWLQTTQDPVIPTIDEKDVKIVHRKENDTLLFYATTILVPILIIGLGALRVGRRRRK